MNRREFFQSTALAGGAIIGSQLLANSNTLAATKGTTPHSGIQAFPRKYEAKPLPFNPEYLKGLSSKLILSHHDNNYAGAVKNLMKVEAEIAKLNSDSLPFVWTALKSSEQTFRNSMVMHELYFENLGGNGKIHGPVEKLITSAWGTTSRFETEFKASGLGIGGGTGWIVLSLDKRTSQPIISCLGALNQFAANAVPLLLMDVYEHAYAIDYGAGIKDYIEAFFSNINWEIVNKRLEAPPTMAG